MFDRIFKGHGPNPKAFEFLKYIGPGFIVTAGFIDPGNWAANMAAGSQFGYSLLWVVSLSTAMLIVLQHYAAHLGIVTGLCVSEASTLHMPRAASLPFLGTAVIAAVSTALAEVLGAAIGLKMLTGLPLTIGSALTAIAAALVTFTKGYRRIEKYIIASVSLVGLAFVYEMYLTGTEWGTAAAAWVVPSVPDGSLIIVMSVLGAVVMPHNIFLHSEVIQSRQWNLKGEDAIKRQLKYEFTDTLLAMGAGWAINSAMIIVAAAVFFRNGVVVTELSEAHAVLSPLLGRAAATVFALALVLAGFSSSVTASMAAGSIFAGLYGEPLDMKDNHTRSGVLLTLAAAVAAVFFLSDPFKGLIWSQVVLSMQLPFTVLGLTVLTSSRKVMGAYKNRGWEMAMLWGLTAFVTVLNAALLWDTLRS
jgi:manganese transport protein